MARRWMPASAAAPKRSSLTGLGADQGEYLVPLLLHVVARDERLEVEPQERLGVRRAHAEVPVGVVHGHAVEVRDLAVGPALLDLAHLPLLVRPLGVDLAGDEVALPERCEQFAHALLALGQ